MTPKNRISFMDDPSVDQRAAKLLTVKVGVLKKKSAASAIPPKVCASAFGPGSSTSGVESFLKFDNQQICVQAHLARV